MKKFAGIVVAVMLMVLAWTTPPSARTVELLDIPVSSEINGLDPDLVSAVERDVPELMRTLRSPGLGVGIVAGNTLVYQGYFGWQDLEAGEPVAPNTMFRIGSISKSLTAIGLLQLWEQGRFQLDDDVNQYLPGALFFPPHPDTDPVTFRHLLTHTSGAGEFLSYTQVVTPGLGIMVKGDDYRPLGEYLKLGFHTKIDPGVKWAYSNYGFALLGYSLECMAGVPFNDYMRHNVFAPLGMTETTYEHTAAMLPRIAVGYSPQKDNRYQPTSHQAYGATPAGNVYSTVREFALYVEALVNGGTNRNGSVIKPETLAMMMDKQWTHDPRQGAYGFGLRHYGDDVWGRRIVGHSGSVPFGYTSMMLLSPDERVGVFVFANTGANAPGEICWKILQTVLRAEDPLLPAVEPDRSVWPELIGYYGPEYRDFKTSTRIYMSGVGRYHVDVEDDELVLIYQWQGPKSALVLHRVSADDPYYFWYEDPDHPRVEGPRYLSFHRGDNGWIYLVPGGEEEFIMLDRDREDRALLISPVGRVLAKINPL